MRALATLSAVLLLTACAPETPDYQSIWDSSTPVTTTAPAAAAAPVPIAVYLEQSGVIGEPMTPDTLTGITVTLPIPQGWQKVEDPNLRDTYEVLRKPVDTGYQPTAMVIVMRLVGDFDVAEAMTHANTDAEMSEAWTGLNASTEDFDGQPSSMIEGSYNLLGQRVHTYHRIVMPTTAAPEAFRYLVQFTVTTAADEAVAHAADVEQLIEGFKVTVD